MLRNTIPRVEQLVIQTTSCQRDLWTMLRRALWKSASRGNHSYHDNHMLGMIQRDFGGEDGKVTAA